MPALLRAPTREYRNPIMDSRRWDGFKARSGDIIVATYPKCGTTWTQRIVDMLLRQSTAPRPIMETYPWLDACIFGPVEQVLDGLEAQTERRSIKSHLPFDSLPVFQDVKYIHVARDGRDACFSMHNHQLGFTDEAKQRMAASAAQMGMAGARPPPIPEAPRDYYLQWISEAETGTGLRGPMSFFEFEMTYWRERASKDLLLVHYNDLKADLAGEIRRISTFLEIETPGDLLAEMAQAARFETMKAEGEALLPRMKDQFDRGHDRFLNKGTNGRWRDVLTEDDLARYAALAKKQLPAGAAAWIERGRLAAGDPKSLAD
jgi:aryl sulfotransferase